MQIGATDITFKHFTFGILAVISASIAAWGCIDPFNPIVLLFGIAGTGGFVVLIYRDIAQQRASEIYWREHKRKVAESRVRIAGERAAQAATFGPFAESVLQKKLQLNMTAEMVIFIYGDPADRKEEVRREKRWDYLYYGAYRTRQGNTKYKFMITLENGIVSGWQDL